MDSSYAGRSTDVKAFLPRPLFKPVLGAKVAPQLPVLLYGQRLNTQPEEMEPRAPWETVHLYSEQPGFLKQSPLFKQRSSNALAAWQR